jgi:hypothetical protein
MDTRRALKATGVIVIETPKNINRLGELNAILQHVVHQPSFTPHFLGLESTSLLLRFANWRFEMIH